MMLKKVIKSIIKLQKNREYIKRLEQEKKIIQKQPILQSYYHCERNNNENNHYRKQATIIQTHKRKSNKAIANTSVVAAP